AQGWQQCGRARFGLLRDVPLRRVFSAFQRTASLSRVVAYRPIFGSLGPKLGPRRLNRKGRGFVKTARAYPWAVPYLFHSYIRVSGRIRARATHEKSATESGNAETILVASYLKTGVSTAAAPRKYGTVLVLE